MLGLCSVCMPIANARADVILEGVNRDMSDAILHALTLPEGCNQSDWLVRYRFRNSQREIATVLQTWGYYSPVITPKLSFDDKCWHAYFKIDLGPPAKIEQADIALEGEGKDFPQLEQIIHRTAVRKGNTFDHDSWEALKTDLANVAAQYGFLDADFAEHKVEIDAVHNTADVHLIYKTGPRYKFGETRFETDALRDVLLRRYIPYKVGDPYDSHELATLYQSLLDSGYFDDVLLDTSETHGDEVIVKVTPTVGKRASTRIGLGYSTDQGANATVGRDVKLVNDRGHKLSANLSISQIETNLGANYRIPQPDDKDSWITLYGGFQAQHTDTSKTSKTTLGVRRVMPRRAGWVETRFVEVTNDRFQVADTDSSTLAVVPGINFSHTWADSVAARPMHAHNYELELSGTSTALGSTIDYFKATARAKVITSITDSSRFIGRIKVGAVYSSNFDSLPPGVRFFTGGDDSVRGFDYHELGAVDAEGNVVGGDRLIVGSVELDHQVLPHWAVATFFDAGSVSLSRFSGTFDRSAGVGVRWYSPIGPVRIDFAQPLDTKGRGIRLHISLGPDL